MQTPTMPAPITPTRLPFPAAIRVSRLIPAWRSREPRAMPRRESSRRLRAEQTQASPNKLAEQAGFRPIRCDRRTKGGGLVMAAAALARFPATTRDEAPLSAAGSRGITPARLTEAVSALHLAQRRYSREKQPVEWAMLQNNLGNALAALGERESGTQHVEEAIAAYRGALEVYVRSRQPLEWAMTQN